jgi:hypothetical protein
LHLFRLWSAGLATLLAALPGVLTTLLAALARLLLLLTRLLLSALTTLLLSALDLLVLLARIHSIIHDFLQGVSPRRPMRGRARMFRHP